ncbi:hypothetical protein CALVIDRAFT_541589 [Calocera viscosa TUFC12733]|uniref:C3H1-type domain-containing protein n=1 Tax=Calocera viscosa (strain TUFC12733) TaxID=1330018 RepID=A0A167HJ04_CALVF|nr:hypothetical protein CALVIDRAFT_541589 [Calocera viscosa TUFC12733]
MPSKKGKKPGKGSRGKVNIRCWFYEGKNISGCPTPDTCRYVHPWEPEWPTVASAQTVIRCNYFDHDGAPIGGGCPRGSSCRFV